MVYMVEINIDRRINRTTPFNLTDVSTVHLSTDSMGQFFKRSLT